MNTGNFAGFIGRDAETKALPSGQSVTNFSIGVSTFKGQEKSTLWVACAMWGDRGAKVAQYLTKGQAVSVSGDVDVRAYASKDGQPKAEITCNVQRLTLQGKNGERSEVDRPAASTPQKTPQQLAREANRAPVPDGSDFEPDSQIPF